MIRKYASLAILDAEIETGAPVGLRRTAHRVAFNYEARPGYLYVRSRMISSRCNDNYDEFTPEEIKGDGKTVGYVTFIGKPVFVNHHNEDHRRARGIILDAKLHEDRNPDGSPDTWVEGLMEVDAVRFPKLAKAILAGEIDRTSMGVDVERSQCSKCANVATTPLEYCRHIPSMKGTKIYQFTASGERKPHLVRERCFGLRFFENSLLVEEPADPTAYFLDKPVEGPKVTATRRTASRQGAPMPKLEPKVGMHRCALCFSEDTLTMLGHVECGNCGCISVVKTGGAKPAYPNPADHPAWETIGAHPDNIVEHWHAASDEEKREGIRWYSDAQQLNKAIAHHTGYSEDTTAGVQSAYSPQVEWHTNVHNAMRSLHQGWPIGPGEGTNVMQMHQDIAKKMMFHDVPNQKALNGPKTNAFAHLLQHGGMDPERPGEYSQRVCVDRHAMSVLAGHTLDEDHEQKAATKVLSSHHYYSHAEHMYQQAAKQISDHEGYEIAPHQVQAVTWGVRQRRNYEQNERLRKQVATTQAREKQKNRDLRGEMGMELNPGNVHANRRGRRPFVRNAYGETKAPADVDTLRDEECPICGESTSYDGNQCAVCGFVQPPKEFQDPDLELAQKLDLRKDDADPMGMDVSDVAGIEDSINDPNRDGIDDSTGLPMEQGGDPEMGQDPDLICPVCGEGFSSQPTSVSMENPMADSLGEQGPDPEKQDPAEDQADDQNPDMAAQEDDNAAEGDPCPNCGQGVLTTPGQAQTEMGEDPEAAAEVGEPGTGDPTVDPDADPDDLNGSDDAEPGKGGNPFGNDEDEGDEARDEEQEEEDDPDADARREQFGDDEEEPREDDEDDDEEEQPAGHTPWKR